MKLYITLILVSVLQFGYAGFDLPRNAFHIDDLALAEEEAIENDKPLTFIISNTETRCGLCVRVSEEIMDGLRQKTVVVYIPSSGEKRPEKLMNLTRGADRGEYVPYAFVVTNDYETLVSTLKYVEVEEDGRKAIRAVKKAILALK